MILPDPVSLATIHALGINDHAFTNLIFAPA